MAGHSSTYLDQLIVDHLNGVTPYTPAASGWIALTTVVLTKTDTTMPAGVEMVGLGYQRALIANDATTWSPAAIDVASGKMTSHNIVDVVFEDATDDWPTLPGWAKMDAPVGGNVLRSGAFEDQVGLVSNGQTPIIQAGSLLLVVG